MCATCVAQGTLYVGGAVGALRLMAARASAKRHSAGDGPADEDTTESVSSELAGTVDRS